MKTATLTRTLLLVGILTLLSSSGRAQPEPAEALAAGAAAPPLAIAKLVQAPEGAAADWQSLRGKVVVLEFWATWCGPCIAAIPHLNELADGFKDEQVVFLSITAEDEALVKRFLERKPMHTWVALDDNRATNKAYNVTAIPKTVLVDRDGAILGIGHPTGLTSEILHKALRGEAVEFGAPEAPGPAVPAMKVAPAKPRRETGFVPGRLPGEGMDGDHTPEPLMQVIIRPAPEGELGASTGSAAGRRTYLNMTAEALLKSAFEAQGRVDVRADLLEDRFDVAVWAPKDQPDVAAKMLCQSLTSAFRVRERLEQREVEVLVLQAEPDAAEKLEPSVSTGGSSTSFSDGGDSRQLKVISGRIETIRAALESDLGQPVLNDTGLGGAYDFNLAWDRGDADSAAAAVAALGLKLVPQQRVLDYVVIEPAR